MKQFFIIVLFFCIAISADAGETVATITLKVKNGKKASIAFTLPVNHTVFWGAVREDTLRSENYHIVLSETQTGFVDIRIFNFNIRLFVQKGDNLRLFIDEENTEKPLAIEGNNKAGQEAFTSLELPYPGNLVPRYKRDSTAILLEQHMESDKNVRLNLFKVLYDERKIDKTFMDYMQLNLDYYHASVLSEVIAGRYALTLLPEDHLSYTPVFPADLAVLWEKVYKEFPVNNLAALKTFGYNPGFSSYARNYISGYLQWIRNRNKPGVSTPYNPTMALKETFDAIRNNLLPAVAEYLEAGILFTELGNEQHFTDLVKYADHFKNRYPKSGYMVYLEPLVKKANAYFDRVKGDFSVEQKLITGYNGINSFRDLMAPFMGKVVFIEFWASWCITCKDQFDYENDLAKYLNSKEVEHLFISVDNDMQDTKWKELIKYYNLRGSHVRANESLLKDISRIFWQGKGYALPLYVVINRAGTIVEADAHRPSEKRKLYAEIGKYAD